MDPISLAASWALDTAKKAVDDPAGVASLVRTIQEVILAPAKAKEQENLMNIKGQSDRAIRLIGPEEFDRSTRMFFFKDWLELAALSPAHDRFSSDFCVIALESIRRSDPSTQYIIAVGKVLSAETKRRFIIWVRGLGRATITDLELIQLRSLRLIRNVDQRSKPQEILINIATVAVIPSILLGITLIGCICFALIHVLFPSINHTYQDGSLLSDKILSAFLAGLAFAGGLALLFSAIYFIWNAIEDNKPFTLTETGDELKRLLGGIPSDG